MEVINFEDKDIKFVLLESGKYLIDNELININGYHKEKVKVMNENDIRKVTDNSVIDYYLNVETNEKLSEYDYSRIIEKLRSKITYVNEDEYEWETLEDEYSYKKFKSIHKAIHKNIQSISDPIKVEIIKAQYDTGNKFIKNAYLNGTGKIDLFEYNQHEAWLDIVSECFNELHMVFDDDCGYSYTNDKKVWGNSSRSCIRYVVAFGTYIFNDEFRSPGILRGTLDDMVGRYNQDRNKIRKIIKTKYNLSFGKIEEDNVDFTKVLNDLYSLRSSVNSIESKKSTWTNQNQANKKVNELIDYLESKYEQ